MVPKETEELELHELQSLPGDRDSQSYIDSSTVTMDTAISETVILSDEKQNIIHS